MRKISLILFLLLSDKLLFAQNEDTSYVYWITIGAMYGGFEKDLMSGNLNYTCSIGSNFYKAGYLLKGSTLDGNNRVGKDNYLYHSIDISIGKRKKTEWFQASVFVGPSYIYGKKRLTDDSYENYKTVGLQSDLQVLFRIANEVGIGVDLYGNLNLENNFAGVNVNITLGNGK